MITMEETGAPETVQEKPKIEKIPPKPQIKLDPGQTWEDKDKRRPGRRLTIKDLDGDYVVCETVIGKKTKIGTKRFQDGRFKLIHNR
jgi:hypothetical protein